MGSRGKARSVGVNGGSERIGDRRKEGEVKKKIGKKKGKKLNSQARKGKPSQTSRFEIEKTQSCSSILEFLNKRKKEELSPEKEGQLTRKRNSSETGILEIEDSEESRKRRNGKKKEIIAITSDKDISGKEKTTMTDQWEDRSERDILVVLWK